MARHRNTPEANTEPLKVRIQFFSVPNISLLFDIPLTTFDTPGNKLNINVLDINFKESHKAPRNFCSFFLPVAVFILVVAGYYQFGLFVDLLV